MSLSIFLPITYTRRLTFDGRAGKFVAETGKVELEIKSDPNFPVSSLTQPWKDLVSSISNRLIVGSEDPLLYSGLLEPKNGRSVQEYYSDVTNLVKERSLWLSEDNLAVQNTLGGLSIAIVKDFPTVENVAKALIEYLSITVNSKVLENYISLTFESTDKRAKYSFKEGN